MFSFLWPILLVVFSNVVYQICAKSVPESVNPLASLTITYSIGALASAALFFATGKGQSLFSEYRKMNWSSYALGIAVLGLEVGFIYAYKAGWQVSTASIVQSSVLSLALIVVGYFLFHETITWNKLLGIGICMVGLFFINFK